MAASKEESWRISREGRPARFIARADAVSPVFLSGDHGGEGTVLFRRLFGPGDWEGSIDFVDHAIVLPGTSIGVHRHEGNDEIYLVVSGTARMVVDGTEHRIAARDVVVTPSGSSHGLVNDGDEPLVMFVVQVGRR
jgi:mannose-6-phosphate isomerase-like protein (cupin superfamily)